MRLVGGETPVVDGKVADLIGAIYDAVLDPAMWHDALDRIRRHYRFHNSILGIARYGHQPGSLLVPVNIPDDYRLAMQRPEYSDEVIRLWGGREVCQDQASSGSLMNFEYG